MVDNLEGLGPSVWNSIQWVDLWIVFPSIAFLAYYNKFMKLFPAGDCRTDLKLLAGSVLLIFMIEAPSYILHKPTEYAHPYGLYRNEIIRAYRQFGFINYWIYEVKYLRGCTAENVCNEIYGDIETKETGYSIGREA